MTEVRRCPDCHVEERRERDDRGHERVNLDPTTGRCVDCLRNAAAQAHTFHSRRDDRHGEVIDTKQLQAGKDGD